MADHHGNSDEDQVQQHGPPPFELGSVVQHDSAQVCSDEQQNGSHSSGSGENDAVGVPMSGVGASGVGFSGAGQNDPDFSSFVSKESDPLAPDPNRPELCKLDEDEHHFGTLELYPTQNDPEPSEPELNNDLELSGGQRRNDLEASVPRQADSEIRSGRPTNSASQGVEWDDPNFVGREMIDAVAEQGNPPPYSRHQQHDPPPLLQHQGDDPPAYSRHQQDNASSAARSGAGGFGVPVVVTTMSPGYRPRPRPFAIGTVSGPGRRPIIIRADPERMVPSVITRVPEYGNRVFVSGNIGTGRGAPILTRDIPGTGRGAPILTRDIPVSDTEAFIPRSRTVTPQRRQKTKTRWFVCFLTTIVLMVAVPAIMGVLISNRNGSHSDHRGWESTDNDGVATVQGATFYGSFLFEDRWNHEMSDVHSSYFQSNAQLLEKLIDQFYSLSDLAYRFDHSRVTELSKEKSDMVRVTVSLKLKDWVRRNPGKSELQAADLKEAFLTGRRNLLSSASVSQQTRKALAIKIVPASLLMTSTPMTTTTTTARVPAWMTTRVPAWETTRSPIWKPSTEKPPDVPCGEVRVLPNLRIVGGSEALKGGYPWMVMLIKNTRTKNGVFFCGGSILDRWNIITAAHCLEEETKDSWTKIVNTKHNQITVIAGKHESKTTVRYPYEQRIPAQAGYMHPSFAQTTNIKNDIAVIRLSRPLQFNSRVGPLCLPETSDPLPPICVIAGWGSLDYENEDLPKTLQTATLRVYNRTECQRRFQSEFHYLGHTIHYFLAEGIMCASNGTFGGQDTCQGDSGGPLFCLQEGAGGERHYTQFGVVSWGVGCGNPGEPGFYTSLPHFVTWIRSQALPYLDQHTSSEQSDSTCRTFSPMTDYHLSSCRRKLQLLKYDISQCSHMSGAVICVVNALEGSGHVCTEQEVFSTILSASSVGLSSQQQQQCIQHYTPSQSHSSAICHNHTALSDAVKICTQNLTCVSMLEVTVCVHSFVDPAWQQCSRQALQDYIETHFKDSVLICEDYTVRTMADGRHFVYMGGDWYVLCGDHWGHLEVKVACTQRGFKAGISSYLYKTDENVYVSDYLYEHSGAHRSIKASGWLKATCSGYEKKLAECEMVHQTTCSSSYLAASVCYNKVYKFSVYSLEPEPGPHGYMRLSRDEGKGNVCVPELSDTAAHLLCRQAGYVGGMVYPQAMPPPSSPALWETEMRCGAGAVDVNGCSRGNWTLLSQQSGSRSCTLAKVFCFRRNVRLHNGLYNRTGIVQMYRPAPNGHGVTLKTVCRKGFDDVAARLACSDATNGVADARSLSFNPFYKPNTDYVSVHCPRQLGSLDDCEVQDAKVEVCAEPAVVSCNPLGNNELDLSVRLSTPSSQVQVSMGEQWGMLCTDHWTDNEAAAICRQLGHLYGYRRFPTWEDKVKRSLPHVLHSVRCGVNASSLQQCSYQPVTSDVCQHSPPAAVLCSDRPRPVYLLQNSSSSWTNKGFVYVNYNGTTAPLRGQLSNVSALCQKLGYVTGERKYYYTPHTRHNLWYVLPAGCSGVECLRADPVLVNCTRGNYHDYRCSDSDVSVFCYTSAARVNTGAEKTTGIVQLYQRGTWWEVCHDDITQPAADIICHDIMRSPTASAIILRNVYRLGIYQTVQASVYCDARDSRMKSSDCIVLDLNSKCESFNNDPASVVCYDGMKPSGAVTSWKIDYNHRVWAKRYGVWGTVCMDTWTNSQAKLLCKHVDDSHRYGSISSTIRKHDSTTPMWVWSVNCDLLDYDETDLDNCHLNLTSVVKGECRSNMDATAVCSSYANYNLGNIYG